MNKPVLSRFADYAVILHCQIRTAPGREWDVQNEFNRRLKDRFDSRGIAMPVTGVASMLKRSKNTRPDA